MSQTEPSSAGKLQRVLVVVKKTTYQQEVVERKDPKALKMLAEGHKSVMQWRKTDDEHKDSLHALEEAFKALGIEYKLIDRSQLSTETNDYNLVISLGGDGTFLDTSHALTTTPLLGVNSAVSTSHGHWCLGRKDNLNQILAEISNGSRSPIAVMRLEISINGKALPIPVLNELFFGHACPAGTTRFFLEINGQQEELRSSGILIGSGAGSTGWMRSAGGDVLPVTAQQYQYLVREPCIFPGENPKLLRGLLNRNDRIKLLSLMPEGKIFVDGSNISYDTVRGDEVVVKVHPHDLMAYISADSNTAYGPH